MNKFFMFIATVFFVFTAMNAQDMNNENNKIDINSAIDNDNAEDFSTTLVKETLFGFKGGVNQSTITGDNVDSFTCLTCFHLGILAEIMFSDVFAFQPELLYSCQGSDYRETSESVDFPTTNTKALYKGTIKLGYINMPLMAKYYVTDGLSLEAGPQVGFLISAKEEYDWAGDTGEEDIKEHLKGIDFGVNFGLGYKFEGGLNIGARYNLGLSDGNDNPQFLGDSTYKNSVFQFSIGYFF